LSLRDSRTKRPSSRTASFHIVDEKTKYDYFDNMNVSEKFAAASSILDLDPASLEPGHIDTLQTAIRGHNTADTTVAQHAVFQRVRELLLRHDAPLPMNDVTTPQEAGIGITRLLGYPPLEQRCTFTVDPTTTLQCTVTPTQQDCVFSLSGEVTSEGTAISFSATIDCGGKLQGSKMVLPQSSSNPCISIGYVDQRRIGSCQYHYVLPGESPPKPSDRQFIIIVTRSSQVYAGTDLLPSSQQ
jgi:hypothetical protein